MFKGLKVLIFFALLPLFLVFASPASAETWSTPQQISNSANNAAFPATATGPNGYLHTVWMEFNGVYNESTAGVYYSYWNGDTWSAPLKISQDLGYAELPWVTATGTQTSYKVHTVWDEGATWDTAGIYYKSYDSSTSTWSTPTNLLQSLDIAGSCAWNPKTASDASGNLHTIFEYSSVCNNGINEVYYTKYNGSSWSAPLKLSVKGSDDQIFAATIAIDTSNNPHVILPEYGRTDSDPQRGIYETYYNGTSWSTPNKLAPVGKDTIAFVQLVIDNNNNRHLAYTANDWYDYPAQTYKTAISYMKYNGSSWSSPVVISNNATYSWWVNPIFGITFDSQNRIYVGWGERVGWAGDPKHGVQVSYKSSTDGVTWSSPVFMRYVYELDSPFLYRDKWDNQHFAWTEQDETTKQWTLWYSTVPINIQTYDPANAFTMTLGTTSDTLTIPSGSSTSAVSISAQIGPLPASYDPLYTTLPRSYTFRPHGLNFIGGNKVAKATIYYTDGEIMGTDERIMKIYVWDGSTNSWSTAFPTFTNSSQNKSVVTLPHFSLYGLGAPKIETRFQSPSPEVNGATIPVNYQLVNLFTGQPADPPAERTVEDTTDPENPTTTPFWDEYKAKLFDSQGSLLQTLSYDAGNGTLAYDTTANTYSGQFPGENLPEGNYTLKVYLATIEVGSYAFHYTYVPTPPSVSFLPPLTNDELYTMSDNSTLPVKLQLTKNGQIYATEESLSLLVTSTIAGNPFSQTIPLSFDPLTNTYLAHIRTKELGMGLGSYKATVVSTSTQLMESTTTILFSLLDQGKAKGQIK